MWVRENNQSTNNKKYEKKEETLTEKNEEISE